MDFTQIWGSSELSFQNVLMLVLKGKLMEFTREEKSEFRWQLFLKLIVTENEKFPNPVLNRKIGLFRKDIILY